MKTLFVVSGLLVAFHAEAASFEAKFNNGKGMTAEMRQSSPSEKTVLKGLASAIKEWGDLDIQLTMNNGRSLHLVSSKAVEGQSETNQKVKKACFYRVVSGSVSSNSDWMKRSHEECVYEGLKALTDTSDWKSVRTENSEYIKGVKGKYFQMERAFDISVQ
ncbi:MAG: hypothetical protein JNL01_09460 [Bdellovibrionales bacterium]|nr:hypothetical protein [Bdellovibrionales bacterium]